MEGKRDLQSHLQLLCDYNEKFNRQKVTSMSKWSQRDWWESDRHMSGKTLDEIRDQGALSHSAINRGVCWSSQNGKFLDVPERSVNRKTGSREQSVFDCTIKATTLAKAMKSGFMTVHCRSDAKRVCNKVTETLYIQLHHRKVLMHSVSMPIKVSHYVLLLNNLEQR